MDVPGNGCCIMHHDNYTPADSSQSHLQEADEETQLGNYLREPRISRSANVYMQLLEQQPVSQSRAGRKEVFVSSADKRRQRETVQCCRPNLCRPLQQPPRRKR